MKKPDLKYWGIILLIILTQLLYWYQFFTVKGGQMNKRKYHDETLHDCSCLASSHKPFDSNQVVKMDCRDDDCCFCEEEQHLEEEEYFRFKYKVISNA